MQKIDIGGQSKPQSAGGAQASSGAAATGSLRRLKGTWAAEARDRIGGYFGNRKLRKLASAVQTSEQDIRAITGKNHEQLITDLSRVLLCVERDFQEGSPDQVDVLFQTMLQENIRRLLMVQKSLAPARGI